MATFYVGQRVRIVAAHTQMGEKVVGAHAVVNVASCRNARGEHGYVGVTIGTEDNWCFLPHQLEPILNPPLEACDEDFKRDLDRLLERQGIAA
jgi:hypothetical protein